MIGRKEIFYAYLKPGQPFNLSVVITYQQSKCNMHQWGDSSSNKSTNNCKN